MKKRVLLIICVFLLILVVTSCQSSSSVSGGKTAPKTPQALEEPIPSEEPEESKEPEKVVYKQSPYLEEKDLPPVEERLPKEPKIAYEMPEEFDMEIGTYGGTYRSAHSAAEWDPDVFCAANEALLGTPGALGVEITGNVLKGYDVSADQKEFTFYLREGLKWSDGEPVTTEDFRFVWEDVINNSELTPIFPSWLNSAAKADGKPAVFEFLDEYTFKVRFDEPYGGFPVRIAIRGWTGYTELLKPAHYLKQFHKKYADANELEEKIKEVGLQPGEWVSLFHDKDIVNWELFSTKAIGFPALYPWLLTKRADNMSEMERNPYYFKIDKAGNQLPYLDKIVSYQLQDNEMVNMKIIAGEVDYSQETALMKLSLYKENEKNGYKVYLSRQHVTPADIFLNLTYEDTVWRQVVRDIRFRKALNMALDRQEIIDSIYYGFAEPTS